jgi:[CysO sulfur-carrier protein]-S-L-cysteine hydrolase
VADPQVASPVQVPVDVEAAVWAHVRAEAPHEGCGLLLGRPGALVHAWPARNRLASATRYEIHPEDHFAALREARRLGLEVIGAYHSHPASPAVPSATDLAEAFAGFLFVIASLMPGGPAAALRGWALRDGNFEEIALVRTPQ